MRRIMVLNSKGGSGKSTIATNLAGYYARQGKWVQLLDFDPQRSSYSWNMQRSSDLPKIHAVSALPQELLLAQGQGVTIIDTPAGILDQKELKAHAKMIQTIIIPVLPSMIDIRAATYFIEQLLLVGRISRDKTRVAVIANRVRTQTVIYRQLQKFLRSLDIPFVASLRDSQNYIHCAADGTTIFDMPASRAEADWLQWKPLLAWLSSAESMPLKKR